MIVRILGEGQLEVDERHLAELNELDGAVTDAVDAGEEARFQQALARLIERVRNLGSPVPHDFLGESDIVLPDPGSDLAGVRALLGEEGLIPG